MKAHEVVGVPLRLSKTELNKKLKVKRGRIKSVSTTQKDRFLTTIVIRVPAPPKKTIEARISSPTKILLTKEFLVITEKYRAEEPSEKYSEEEPSEEYRDERSEQYRDNRDKPKKDEVETIEGADDGAAHGLDSQGLK